jgi:TetR/AcrR family transcriptional regulator of autoinduction and epiphytic fitness
MVSASSRSEKKGPSRKARTRSAILDAAATCFGEKGFLGTSMDEIGQKAGVTKPTLYAHFESKEGLFDSLLYFFFSQMKDRDLPEVSTVEEVESALRTHAESHLDMMMQEPVFGLTQAAVAETMRRPQWARGLMASLEDNRFQKWLSRLNQDGVLHIKNVPLANEMFWGLVKGPLFYPAALAFREKPEKREMRRVIKEAVRIFVDAHQVR